MLNLIVATHNRGKMQEIQELLSGMSVTVRCLSDVDPEFTVVEDGETFAQNAVKKAEAVCARYGCAALADDSGLCVDALGGAPGVYSARFAGEDTTYERNNQKLLELLQDIKDRSARFVCVMALALPGRQTITVEGVCEGAIAQKLSGDGGFGYDPLFVPRGYRDTFAQLGSDVKNRISHRAVALHKMKERLAALEGL
jgi:XTP/dITP diphosphohydrolase